MKITCSILCYNYGRYLTQAIESCLHQEPGEYDLEVLVIDDGSTDETPDICQKYQQYIRVVRSPNEGFAASLDKAIKEASGDYVCLLDADDFFARNKLLTILPEIQKGYLYIEHQQYYVNQDGELIDGIVHGGSNTSTLCLNRNAALTLLPVQNEIFFHPLKSAGYGFVVEQPLTFYRLHGSNMTNFQKAGVQYYYLAKVTHTLADQLLSMVKEPPAWTNAKTLKKLSQEYRAIAYYDEMEAALELGKRSQVLWACWNILVAAMNSQSRITAWHLKVIFRGILGKPIFPNKAI